MENTPTIPPLLSQLNFSKSTHFHPAVMLKTIDKYIIRKFLRTFFFTVLIFTLISVVIDFSENVERFIEQPITGRQVALGYYPSFILYIAGLLWPLFTMIAVIFFTSRMAYDSEIIAIFNAGVSFQRLLFPYLLAAGFIALLHLVGNHIVIPQGNKVRLDLVYTYLHTNEDKGQTDNVHLFVAPDTKVFIKNYRKRDSSAIQLHLEQFQENRLVFLLKAETAKWIGPPNQWRLSDYEVRRFNGLKEEYLLAKGEQLDTTFNLTPEDFVDYQSQQEMMTTRQLQQYIRKQKERGAGNTRKYELEVQRRSAEPFTIFILTIIGMSIAARKVRGGIGLHLALGVGLGAIFIFLSRFAIVFSTGQALPVFLGIWMPNIVFTLIAVVLIQRAQK